MTYDELKAEAKAMGYNLIKKSAPMPKFLPCVCGNNRRYHWWSSGPFYKCTKCGRKSPPAKGERAAREAWNKMIMEALKDADDRR